MPSGLLVQHGQRESLTLCEVCSFGVKDNGSVRVFANLGFKSNV